MRVAIHQPNFLPWIGYFNKIKSVECFVFLDDVQFERGKTYTSRTKILLQGVENWLTIPIINKSSLAFIKDTMVVDDFIWKSRHLKTLITNYKKAPFFDSVFSIIENAYKNDSKFLIDYNIPIIINICNFLEIPTEFKSSSEIRNVNMQGSDKILSILKTLKASEYLSGTGAGSLKYINEEEFRNNGLLLKWQNYEAQMYHQYGTKQFVKNLSIIDLLFNVGKSAGVLL